MMLMQTSIDLEIGLILNLNTHGVELTMDKYRSSVYLLCSLQITANLQVFLKVKKRNHENIEIL